MLFFLNLIFFLESCFFFFFTKCTTYGAFKIWAYTVRMSKEGPPTLLQDLQRQLKDFNINKDNPGLRLVIKFFFPFSILFWYNSLTNPKIPKLSLIHQNRLAKIIGSPQTHLSKLYACCEIGKVTLLTPSTTHCCQVKLHWPRKKHLPKRQKCILPAIAADIEKNVLFIPPNNEFLSLFSQ